MTEILTEDQVAEIWEWHRSASPREARTIAGLIASHRALSERVKELEALVAAAQKHVDAHPDRWPLDPWPGNRRLPG